MKPADPTRTFLYLVLVWMCMTFGIGAVRANGPTRADSQGWRIPAGAAAENNPEPPGPDAIDRGRRLYKDKCQRCHGLDGRGRGPDADLDHRPADLTDGQRASRNPDGVMFYKIWNGRSKPKMPAMNAEISRADVWRVIHYVKTLRK